MAGGRPRNPPNLVPVDQVLQPQQVLDEEWTLLELIQAVDTTEKTIQWLARRGMLRNHLLCHVCGNGMTVSAYNGHIEGKRWKCPAQCRGATKSIRFDSWFQRSHLSLTKCILLLYFWVEDFPQDKICRELGISSHTAVDWCNFVREVCDEDLRRPPQQIGSLDPQTWEPIVVEIDETKYFHRKYHRGQWREEHWVFGGIERDSGKCFMVEVEDRTRPTLEALIQEWILPGSHIISDGWRSYHHVEQIGGRGLYTHDVIVHEHHFVDPNNPLIHTQNIENTLMRAKRKLKRQFGTSEALFQSYMYEFV
ncbi:hypothetical protein ACOMHN_046216 [Nucella lapillus]